jgi:Zn finger protein HypA/HybF involved in hydrogenase expression
MINTEIPIADYEWEMLCLKCNTVYLYREYPPYPDCFNCKSMDVMIRRLK